MPGLSQDMDVEFIINLVPDTTPISRVLYQMAPLEHREFKTQIHELFGAGLHQTERLTLRHSNPLRQEGRQHAVVH